MYLSRRRIAAWTIGTGIAAGSLLLASVSTVRARLDAAPFAVAGQVAIENPLHSEVEARRRRIEEAIARAPASGW